MKQDEAVTLLNRTIFRPGWRITAQPQAGSSTRVQVTFDISTVDTSYPSEQGAYEVPYVMKPPLRLDASRYDTEEDLLYRVLRAVSQHQEHEDREFMRVWRDGRWVANFHPHTDEGASNWERAGQAAYGGAVERMSVLMRRLGEDERAVLGAAGSEQPVKGRAGTSGVGITPNMASVLKVFLEAPDQSRYGLELSRRTGLGHSSLYPMLAKLEEMGLLWAMEDEQADPHVVGRPLRKRYVMPQHAVAGVREEMSRLSEMYRPPEEASSEQ